MKEKQITKTLSLDRSVVHEISKIADQERRSFTRQVEIMLENALKRQKQPENVPAGEKTA